VSVLPLSFAPDQGRHLLFSGRKGELVSPIFMSAIKSFHPARAAAGLLMFAIGAILLRAAPAETPATAIVSQAAPVWKLKDLDGREIGSEQLKGKVVVVDFWATWCVPCIGEIPGYIDLQKKYAADGLVIVGISLDQKGPDHVRKFAESKGMNYRIAMADDNVADLFGGLAVIPTTFLINREGRIVHRKVGAMTHEEYEKIVKQALAHG
jgi:thiol-disulfide isomerase/thioredoxin